MSAPPFRWNLARREQLGSLVEGPAAAAYREFGDDLRDCCVRLLALAGDSELAFVGRSPESIFDYLSGLLADTSRGERCTLLNLSMRYESSREIGRQSPAALRSIRDQLAGLGLSPREIASAPRPHAFVDLVAMGSTFGNLAGLLVHWAEDDGVDAAALRRRMRFVGITQQMKNSPNTWRWYQQVDWAPDFPRAALCSVSIPFRLWTYLGDCQKKVSRWNPPMFWGNEWLDHPPRDSEHLEALRLALRLHERGRNPAERLRVARELAARAEMREPWLRRLVLELRG